MDFALGVLKYVPSIAQWLWRDKFDIQLTRLLVSALSDEQASMISFDSLLNESAIFNENPNDLRRQLISIGARRYTGQNGNEYWGFPARNRSKARVAQRSRNYWLWSSLVLLSAAVTVTAFREDLRFPPMNPIVPEAQSAFFNDAQLLGDGLSGDGRAPESCLRLRIEINNRTFANWSLDHLAKLSDCSHTLTADHFVTLIELLPNYSNTLSDPEGQAFMFLMEAVPHDLTERLWLPLQQKGVPVDDLDRWQADAERRAKISSEI